jgi:hypothetical protein
MVTPTNAVSPETPAGQVPIDVAAWALLAPSRGSMPAAAPVASNCRRLKLGVLVSVMTRSLFGSLATLVGGTTFGSAPQPP